MRSQKSLEQLMSERWPKLKKSAQYERNPEKLIKILEEIDDLLFNVEMRIACEPGQMDSKDDTGTGSTRGTSDVVLSGDSEVECQ